MNRPWYRLDTAGLIFPVIRRNNWINVFRLSATLNEPIDPIILQQAVNDLQPRFPSIYVSLHPGFFWYVLKGVSKPIEVQQDYAYPLTHMGRKEIRQHCMRVYYHDNRIAIEIFHAITDGTGGSIYFRSLLAQYIHLKYNIVIEYGPYVLDPNQSPDPLELEDSFFVHSNGYPKSRKEPVAFHYKGTPEFSNGFLTLTTGVVSTTQLLEVAHQYNSTMTGFLTAVMIQAIIQIQKQKITCFKAKQVKISIASNLRKIFPSKTLRNFVLSSNIGVDPNQGEYTLQELCDLVKHQMKLEFNKHNMGSAIAANVLPQLNPIIRCVPLPLKSLIMDMVYANVGERNHCINISNLGDMQMDEQMKKYIQRMEFIVGVQRSYSNNCSVASVGDTTCINMIRSIKEYEIERLFFSSLVELGVAVSIETNRR